MLGGLSFRSHQDVTFDVVFIGHKEKPHSADAARGFSKRDVARVWVAKRLLLPNARTWSRYETMSLS